MLLYLNVHIADKITAYLDIDIKEDIYLAKYSVSRQIRWTKTFPSDTSIIDIERECSKYIHRNM